jgi:hypothetical protein
MDIIEDIAVTEITVTEVSWVLGNIRALAIATRPVDSSCKVIILHPNIHHIVLKLMMDHMVVH